MATGTTDFSLIHPSAQALCRNIQKSFPDAPWVYDTIGINAGLQLLQLRVNLPTRVRDADVKQMIADFKAGDELPPLLVARSPKTGHIVVLDGAHRTTALLRLQVSDKRHPGKWDSFHAVVINWDYEDAPAAVRDQLTMMIARVNKHGKRYEKGEIETLIASLVGDNSPANIARSMGVSLGTVKSVMFAKEARDKAKAIGLDTSSVSRSAMEKIGRRLPELTEPVEREVFSLVQETPITATEVAHLLDRIGEAGTEQKKTKLARDERSARAHQKDAAKMGIRVGTTPAEKARNQWAYFLDHKNDPTALCETNEMMSPRHLQEGWLVVSILRKMLAAQADLDPGNAIPVTE